MAEPLGGYQTKDGGADMTNPLVSIIIPTYNYAHLIEETLRSVCEQIFSDWECIIIDDGSTDDTAEVVRQFLNRHPYYDFQYIRTVNAGTSAAKNEGIRLARGKYIQFLDADDLLSPDKLHVQVKHLQETESALVFCTSRFFSMINGKQTDQQRYPEGFLATSSLKGYRLFEKLVTNNIITISSPLVKAGLLKATGGFEVNLLNNEDWILWFKIALKQAVFEFDNHPQSFVLIRLHGNSAMNQRSSMYLGEVAVRIEMERLLLQWPVMEERTSLLKLNKDLLALHQVRSLQVMKGMSYIIGSFIKHPVSDLPLLFRAFLKLMVRIYKSVFYS